MNFDDFFSNGTKFHPYPYQQRLAEETDLPLLLQAPTGAGKTEAVVLAWLWRRKKHPDRAVRSNTPRRLVYCLPMRTLVGQTEDRVKGCLDRLGLSDEIPVTILMGGESPDQWWLYPERETIIIGTQDMLISRALNRGYAATPFHWPIDFGLLNNDCLWVMDEVQLLANGLPTSTQMAAFRQALDTYGPCPTLWMSATVHPSWLNTVDFPTPADASILSLGAEDLRNNDLERRRRAVKILHDLALPGTRRVRADQPYDSRELAEALLDRHHPGTQTLAVLNTVSRAQGLYQALQGALDKSSKAPELVLLHSRFRPEERSRATEAIRQAPRAEGRIIVATQAIEAGVDLSARTLVTDLAPWSSLVQRFGRCNRAGSDPQADVYWLDLNEKQAVPYEPRQLERSRIILRNMAGQSVAPANLPAEDEPIEHTATLRRRDLEGLFDTTPDLSGNYLDVSRFVRGTDEVDTQVFWRDWSLEENRPGNVPLPQRAELCSVPLWQLRDFLGSRTAHRVAWRWDYLDREWQQCPPREVRPGQTLLLRSGAGGYSSEIGWDPAAKPPVIPVFRETERPQEPEGYEDEGTNTGQARWVTLREHSMNVRDQARRVVAELQEVGLEPAIMDAISTAAHWHDAGKTHAAFQDMLLRPLADDEKREFQKRVWAKSGQRGGGHSRPNFRHEVASALALLQHAPAALPGWVRDLAAYLVMSHHGKVRLSIRSLRHRDHDRDRNRDSAPGRQYLLGFRTDAPDLLPPIDLGEGVTALKTELDLSIAQMGVNENGERSWLERSLALQNRLGPFRLAYLEALVRAADVRASIDEQRNNGGHNEP